MASSLVPDLSSVSELVRRRRDAALRQGALEDCTEQLGAYIVTIDGAVSVGKSTTAALLADELGGPPDSLDVRVVSSDGFLYPNRVLDARGLTTRKGFPETYDDAALDAFVHAARAGAAELSAPRYSHETYDVLDDLDVFAAPQVLVLEGLHTARLAGLVDLAVYVDADVDDVERWFVERFVELSATPTGFYTAFAGWPRPRLEAFAHEVWASTNGPNLVDHILPNRDRVDVVVTKGADHRIAAVTLRD